MRLPWLSNQGEIMLQAARQRRRRHCEERRLRRSNLRVQGIASLRPAKTTPDCARNTCTHRQVRCDAVALRFRISGCWNMTKLQHGIVLDHPRSACAAPDLHIRGTSAILPTVPAVRHRRLRLFMAGPRRRWRFFFLPIGQHRAERPSPGVFRKLEESRSCVKRTPLI